MKKLYMPFSILIVPDNLDISKYTPDMYRTIPSCSNQIEIVKELLKYSNVTNTKRYAGSSNYAIGLKYNFNGNTYNFTYVNSCYSIINPKNHLNPLTDSIELVKESYLNDFLKQWTTYPELNYSLWK